MEEAAVPSELADAAHAVWDLRVRSEPGPRLEAHRSRHGPALDSESEDKLSSIRFYGACVARACFCAHPHVYWMGVLAPASHLCFVFCSSPTHHISVHGP